MWRGVGFSAAFGLGLADLTEAQTVPLVAPRTARLTECTVSWAGTRPRDPSVAPDGSIWLVGQQADYAARFDTISQEFQRFDLPEGAGPHTVFVDGLARPWYTGNAATHIGRIHPGTGAITQFPTTGASDPHTITFARDGGLWFTAQNANRVGRLDTVTGAVQLLTPPTSSSRPYGIDIAAPPHRHHPRRVYLVCRLFGRTPGAP